ncbi:MAG: hypothetical protein GY750_14915 [Lentisphaerae bacterium]|nr:hypothetical protein [Lentisphaerota bacterium]MCP4102692.1 hypothetical protein [Lentisphaerota bacterium]
MGKKTRKTLLPIAAIEFLPLLSLYFTFRMLSLKAAISLAKGLATLAFKIDTRHRKRAVQHLIHAGITGDPLKAEDIALRSYQEFGMLVVELCKFDQIVRADKISSRIKSTAFDPKDQLDIDEAF